MFDLMRFVPGREPGREMEDDGRLNRFVKPYVLGGGVLKIVDCHFRTLSPYRKRTRPHDSVHILTSRGKPTAQVASNEAIRTSDDYGAREP